MTARKWSKRTFGNHRAGDKECRKITRNQEALSSYSVFLRRGTQWSLYSPATASALPACITVLDVRGSIVEPLLSACLLLLVCRGKVFSVFLLSFSPPSSLHLSFSLSRSLNLSDELLASFAFVSFRFRCSRERDPYREFTSLLHLYLFLHDSYHRFQRTIRAWVNWWCKSHYSYISDQPRIYTIFTAIR